MGVIVIGWASLPPVVWEAPSCATARSAVSEKSFDDKSPSPRRAGFARSTLWPFLVGNCSRRRSFCSPRIFKPPCADCEWHDDHKSTRGGDVRSVLPVGPGAFFWRCVPVRAVVFAICARGDPNAWRAARNLVGAQPARALPSLRAPGNRSRACTASQTEGWTFRSARRWRA